MAPDVQRWGGATGVGSWPGTDPREAARTVLDLLPDLPFLPELPARGVGADLTGRSAALLSGLPAVLAARVPTASGFATLRAPDAARALEVLRTALAAADTTVVHCCAPSP